MLAWACFCALLHIGKKRRPTLIAESAKSVRKVVKIMIWMMVVRMVGITHDMLTTLLRAMLFRLSICMSFMMTWLIMMVLMTIKLLSVMM